jgi:hypothetical protein
MHNFIPVLLLPTRITETSATLIDHIYFFNKNWNCDNDRLICGNIYYQLSDHLSNIFILNKTKSVKTTNERPFIRNFSLNNNETFKYKLSCLRWNAIFYNISDINECFTKFISIVNDLFNECFPLKRISRKAFKDKKWMTGSLKISCKQKSILYRNWLRTKNPLD